MGDGSGVLLVGDKGTIMCNTYGNNPRIIPETKMQAYTQPPKTIPRVEGIHEDFIQGCKGGIKPCSNFDVSGPLSEIVLLGNLAIQMPGHRLLWDGDKMEVTNMVETNQGQGQNRGRGPSLPDVKKLIKREYYGGWTL